MSEKPAVHESVKCYKTPVSFVAAPHFLIFSDMASGYFLLLLFTVIPATAAQQCPIQFDGRVPANTTLATFDTSASLYNPNNVFGQSMLFRIEPSFKVTNIKRSDLV